MSPHTGRCGVKLNNRAVDNAKPREKKWKLADGGGLHLLVHPNANGDLVRLDGKEQEIARMAEELGIDLETE